MDAPTKKELEELREARAQREAADAAAAAVEQLARDVADERALVAAVEKHGSKRIGALKTDLGIVVLKRPHHLHFRELSTKEKLTEADAIAFVKKALVHPTGPELEAMLEELPGIGGDLVALAMKLARGRTEEVTGKS